MAGDFTEGMGVAAGIARLNNNFEWYYGDVEPLEPRPFLNWGHLTEDLWKQRNAENTDWIVRGRLSQPYFGFTGMAETGMFMPIGIPFLWPGETPPSWALEENGAELLRSEFPKLWAKAQTEFKVVTDAEWFSDRKGCYSSGDGSTTFRIPELRGDFIRVWDHGRGIDTGRTLGSYQDDAFQGHLHNVTQEGGGPIGYESNTGSGPAGLFTVPGGGAVGSDSNDRIISITGIITDGVNGTPRIANETRPKNVAGGMICIPHGNLIL